MSLSLSLIEDPTITAWEISTATAQDVQVALATLAIFGWKGSVQCIAQPNSDNLQWTVTMSKSGYQSVTAYNDYWLVWDGANLSSCTYEQLAAQYTANTPLIWAATDTAPTAVAVAGGSATIAFPEPTSVNAPFSYSISKSTNGSTSVAAYSAPSVDDNGIVSITVEGLTAGNVYTFTVTCSTQYTGVSAVSATTAPITATT